ncbi:MAG: metalloregulator ArsR/SmtB family transcription factor [Arenimonas sp.]
MDEYKINQLDHLFGAIADPTRRAILDRLARGEARVTDIAADFPISLNSVSKHLRMRERAGLVKRNIAGREHRLSLNAAPLDAAAAWIDHHRQHWEESLAALEQFVMRKQRKATNRSSNK